MSRNARFRLELRFTSTVAYTYRSDRLAKFFEDALDGFAEDETVAAAATKLGLASMDEALPSMQVKLMPHQVRTDCLYSFRFGPF